MRVLVTGGAGFIGSHLVKHLLRETEWQVIVIDKLTYAARGGARLDVPEAKTNPRLEVLTWDLATPLSVGFKKQLGDVNLIFHLCAESHVDASIVDPVYFIQNNVMSTTYLLEFARELPNLKKFLMFSTDEVYGHAPEGVAYKEWDRQKPGNPYSASKSASEMICISYHNTYQLPVVISRSMNVLGKYQESEKALGLFTHKILRGETIYIHSCPEAKYPGSRNYINVSDIVKATLFIAKNGQDGESYNIAGPREISNLELAQSIASTLKMELQYEMVNFHSTRPGHDLHYRLDDAVLRSLGWKPEISFEETVKEVVEWLILPENKEWLDL